MKNFKILWIILFGFLTSTLFAQDSKGTDFWVMFPGNLSTPTSIPLLITSDVNTSGTVSIPGSAWSMNFNVVAGTITTVNLPTGTEVTVSDAVTNEGVHIVANDEVTVYGFSIRSASTDAFLAFPTDAIGMDYIVLGYKNVNIVQGTQFGIVAAESGTTTVTITPSVTTGARTAGVPYNISLTQGQTYMLRNTLSHPSDLTGSLVSSDKKIAVFGGHECSNIPYGYVACDYLVEQLPPTSSWGTEFVSVPLAGRIGGDTYRFLAQEAGTIVQVDGSTVATLDTGEYYEAILAGYNHITANNPILVGQYSNGTSFDNVQNADPFFLLVPPTDQYLASYVVNTGTPNIPVNYINIVSPSGQTGSVLVDGIAPAGVWTSITGSGFSGLQVSVSAGQHTVSSTLPLGVFVYGFGNYDSYGYLGGQSFSPVAVVNALQLSLQSIIAQQAQKKCFEATVVDQYNAPVVGVKVDFTVQGANTDAGFAYTNGTGVVEWCYVACNVGSDTIIASIAGLTDTVFATVQPSVLSVTPSNASVAAGTQQCATATIVDGSNIPVDNAVVLFEVTGTNPVASTPILTNASGQATFCYTPTSSGNDVIDVTAGCTNGSNATVNVNVTPNNGGPCAASATFKLYGLNSLWVNAGASDPNVFYHGITQWKRIRVNATGGTGPYSYAWSNNMGYTMTNAFGKNVYLFEPLGPSWVICTITDIGANCTFKDSVFVDFSDKYYCGTAANPWQLKMCVNGVNTCMTWAAAKAALIANTATLGDCPTPKTQWNTVSGFAIYPNPTTGYVSLSVPIEFTSKGEISIIDVNGRSVYSEGVNLTEGLFEHNLDLSNLANGIYSVRVVSDKQYFIERMVIQH